ncbi:probable pectinesterase/pectinesterase inhibitor 16 [Typha angustifolia]|uniref:probable pectinesterase/pectinesterase inhibitor 16 n=1 Tax=Typha angustifolia TaxID=59011 RepID=UPI003C2E0602
MTIVHANLSSGDQGSMAICQELLQRSSMLMESLHTEMARGELALTMEAALRGQEMVAEAFDYQRTCLEVLEEDSASKTTNKQLLQLLLSASSTECSTKLSVARMLKRLVNKTPTKVRVQQAKIVLFADLPLRRTITVALDDSGDYKSITDAIGSVSTGTGAQDDDDGYIKIIIAEGNYSENIVIDHNKPRIMLVGAGINRTILSSNRSNEGGWSIYQSATLINEADD